MGVKSAKQEGQARAQPGSRARVSPFGMQSPPPTQAGVRPGLSQTPVSVGSSLGTKMPGFLTQKGLASRSAAEEVREKEAGASDPARSCLI